jgi:hypothetical protein
MIMIGGSVARRQEQQSAPVVPGAEALMKICPSKIVMASVPSLCGSGSLQASLLGWPCGSARLTIIWDVHGSPWPARFRPGSAVIGYRTQSVVRVIRCWISRPRAAAEG